MQAIADQNNYGMTKRDETGKKYFDMENLLTRSLYRVLNNTSQAPAHVSHYSGQNVDKLGFSNGKRGMNVAIAHPNNHKVGSAPSTDLELQMKLLAQEICGRVERKYERKLEAIRDQDRRDTERRLNAIRGEYEAKYQLKLENLEKEKIIMLEVNEERKRNLEQRLDLRLAEKESSLDKKTRMLENRMEELMLNRENFEKMKEEWNRKMDDEMDEIRLEREKLMVNAVQVSSRQKSELVAEHELRLWKKRSQDLESNADETRKKIEELMSENFRLTDEARSVHHLKKELETVLSTLAETREELANSKMENRRTGDFDRIRQENDHLRVEIERLRIQNSQRIQNAVDETIAEYSAREDKLKNVVSGAKSKIAIMTEKCREFQVENEVLKKELKSMQKMVGKSSFSRSSEKSSKKSRLHRVLSPTESTSSLSDGEVEILNIMSRLQNLDEQAKEMDASVHHFSFVNGGGGTHDFDQSDFNAEVEVYDDFCRNLRRKSLVGSPMTSSPQKPIGQTVPDADFEQQQNHVRVSRLVATKVEYDENNDDEHDWLKRNRRVISPPIASESNYTKNTEPFQIPRQSPRRNEVVEKTNSRVEMPESSSKFAARNDSPAISAEPKKPDSPPPPPPQEKSEFEKRMEARGRSAMDQNNRRNQMLRMAEEAEAEERKEEVASGATQAPGAPKDEKKPTSADNPMFSGVDPVMAEYMKKIMAGRNKSETSNDTMTTTTTVSRKPKEVEIMMAEEVELDSED